MDLNPDASAFLPAAAAVENELADPVDMLQSIFPEFGVDSLARFLAEHDNNLMLCVESLLNVTPTEPQASDTRVPTQTASAQASPSVPVCKYFLAGNCLIANCQFLHSKTDRSALCRFHLRGFCARGDKCNFLHDLQSVTPASRPVVPSPPPQPRPVRHPAPIAPIAPPAPVPFDLVAKLKLEQLQRQWSHVNPQIIEECFRTVGNNTASYTDAILRQRYGPPSQELKAPMAAPIRAPPLRRPVARDNAGQALATSTPIVSTGDTISALYLKKRDAAEEHARRRNALFTAATEAFLAGNGALAKELSRKGRYHHQQMEELHKQASGEIFKDRNRDLARNKGLGHIIDVHGLHVTEAIDRLHKCLAQLSADGSVGNGRFLDVITGVGSHSYDGVGKVRPAILQYLRERRYEFQEMSVAGSIRIYLSPNSVDDILCHAGLGCRK